MTRQGFIASAAGAILLAGTASAAPPKPASGEDLLNVSCGDYIAALKVADAGKSPTAERLAQAKKAQDDLFTAMSWVHGYVSGRNGLAKAPTLNSAWVSATIGKLAAVCTNSKPATRLADAAAKL